MRPILAPLTILTLLAAGCAGTWERAPRTAEVRSNRCGAATVPPGSPNAGFQGISVFCFENP